MPEKLAEPISASKENNPLEKVSQLIQEGPVAIKLIQTMLPFLKLVSRKKPEEEMMISLMEQTRTNFGPINQNTISRELNSHPAFASRQIEVDFARPLGNASVAAVLSGRSTLYPDRQLAVKVIKPEAENTFYASFTKLRENLAKYEPPEKNIAERNSIQTLLKTVLELLQTGYSADFDTALEIQSLNKLSKIGLRTPKIYQELSGNKNITMEALTDCQVLADAIKTADYRQRQKIAQKYLAGISKMLRHKIYHGDPHLGNVLLDKKGDLVWIDPSPPLQIGAKDIKMTWKLFRSLYQNKPKEIIGALNDLMEKPFSKKEIKQINDSVQNFQGLELISALIGEGVVPSAKYLVMSRALLVTLGSLTEILPEKGKIANWIPIVFKSYLKSFGKQY